MYANELIKNIEERLIHEVEISALSVGSNPLSEHVPDSLWGWIELACRELTNACIFLLNVYRQSSRIPSQFNMGTGK